MSSQIDRGFQRIKSGLVHYREAGTETAEPPLVMIHGGPGSSAGLVPIIAALSGGRRVIAPDLPGQGDSDPPPAIQITIPFYAEAILAFLDALGIDRFDLYGHHSGAQIACEMSIARPAHVRHLILDGVALFSAEQRRDFLAHYAPPMRPQADGGHLLWAWDFASNLTRFFPYYRRDEASRIVPETLLPPAAITPVAVDLLKVWSTYHILYAAAFSHDLAERLPCVAHPAVLLQVAGDPLARYVADAARLLPESRIERISREGRAASIDALLTRRQRF